MQAGCGARLATNEKTKCWYEASAGSTPMYGDALILLTSTCGEARKNCSGEVEVVEVEVEVEVEVVVRVRTQPRVRARVRVRRRGRDDGEGAGDEHSQVERCSPTHCSFDSLQILLDVRDPQWHGVGGHRVIVNKAIANLDVSRMKQNGGEHARSASATGDGIPT